MTDTSHDRRVAVLFHESETLGAGLSLLRVREHLARRRWALAGWFPGPGPLVTESWRALVGTMQRSRPLASSVRGWLEPPGISHRLVDSPRYVVAVDRWLREVAPSVVHVNSLQLVPEATVARRRQLPVVLQVHELPVAGMKRAITIRWAGQVADVLVGVSDAVSGMLREHAGGTPVITVRNGVAEASARAVEPETCVVGTVGYVSRNKGTDVFLRGAVLALRACPHLRFEHVGAHGLWDDAAFDAQVEALARSPALRSSVTMAGRTSVPEALRRWCIFTLPSRQEAFPLSSLEAMAVGLPVVATRVGGLPEQITHLETGVLIPPDDPVALAEWIVHLHDDGDLRRRLGSAAQNRVRDVFSLDAQADGLAEAYELALERSVLRRLGLRSASRSRISRG